jgi:pyruvate dehydrogenase E1 component alpha subunit/2-oxoisovalerate dehydrogenase E1 component alpha subunit
MADKAHAYGIPATTVDGNDVFAVYETARAAASRARSGGGVSLLEVVTYRRRGHAQHDDQRYQPREEIARWEANDPVDRYIGRVVGDGWLEPAELAAIDEEVTDELNAAVTECEHEPLPDPASALTGVLADPATEAPLWYRRLDG